MRHTLKTIPFVPVSFFQGTAGVDPEYYEEESADWLEPFGYNTIEELDYPIEETFVDPPVPVSDVTITINAYADLDAENESATVYVNEIQVATLVFKYTGHYCNELSVAEIVVPNATWIGIVGLDDATVKVALTDKCDVNDSHCGTFEIARGKIGIHYATVVAIEPSIGPGPMYHIWRSVTQYRNGSGELVWLYATMIWDPVVKQHRWRVQSLPAEKCFYGGMGHSPQEATSYRKGNVSSEVRVPYFYRPRLLKVVGMGECMPI